MLALERGFFCVMVMLVLFSWSTNATSQTPYSSRVEPPFTYVAYQPVLAGNTVTATGVATTSNNSGANFCTYLQEWRACRHIPMWLGWPRQHSEDFELRHILQSRLHIHFPDSRAAGGSGLYVASLVSQPGCHLPSIAQLHDGSKDIARDCVSLVI